MTDVALIWDNVNQRADVAVVGNDLLLDQGLQTAVIISLATDRLAEPGDAIPDASGDPRGWWGDIPIDPGTSDSRRYPIGSRLWLLRRSKYTDAGAGLAIGYAQEALQWLIDDGVAARVDVAAARQAPPLGTLVLGITIVRNTASASGSSVWTMQWDVTAGLPVTGA